MDYGSEASIGSTETVTTKDAFDATDPVKGTYMWMRWIDAMVRSGKVRIGSAFDIRFWDEEWLPSVLEYALHSAKVSNVGDASQAWMK